MIEQNEGTGIGSGSRSAAVALALAWLVVLAPPLGAQGTDPRSRARDVLPAEVLEGVEALARQAEVEGVPVEPLYDKALEGVAKGVPADRILPAVSAQADRLRTVRGVWGPEAGTAVLVAGVDALVKGVPPESLGRLGPTDRTAMSVLVLGDLVESGVLPEDAVGVVREAMARQAGDQDLLAIPSAVRRLLRDGRTPARAVDAVRRALRDGRPVHRVPDVARDGGGPGAPAHPGADPAGRGGDGRSGAGG